MPSNGPIERAIAQALASRRANNNTATSASPYHAYHSIAILENSARNCGRKVQVSTVADRYCVTKWMIDDAIRNGERHIQSRTLRTFPQHFKGSEKAQFGKVGLWWKKREATMALKLPHRRTNAFTGTMANGIRRANFKELQGRGRKKSEWVLAFYPYLLQEFERLR